MNDDDFEHSLGGPIFAPLWRFLSRFATFVNPNPTKDWVRSPGTELVIDLDNNTLNGKTFGEPLSVLSFLGKADECVPMMTTCVDERGKRLGSTEKSYILSYCDDGLSVSTDVKWNIDRFSLDINPFPKARGGSRLHSSQPFAGSVIWNGLSIDKSTLDSVASVIETFGRPDEDRETPAHKTKFRGEEITHDYSRILHYQKPHASWFLFVDETKLVRLMFIGPAIKPVKPAPERTQS